MKYQAEDCDASPRRASLFNGFFDVHVLSPCPFPHGSGSGPVEDRLGHFENLGRLLQPIDSSVLAT